MKIEKINSDKFKITLSCTEILQMNSEIHPMETSDLIHTLLKSLDQEFRFSIINRKILLEMLPSREEGYNIFLTALQTEQNTQKTSNDIVIFSFSQWENVIDALKLLEYRFRKSCFLYLMDETYYLVIRSFQTMNYNIQIRLSDLGESIKNPTRFEAVLLEYASFIADGEILHYL